MTPNPPDGRNPTGDEWHERIEAGQGLLIESAKNAEDQESLDREQRRLDWKQKREERPRHEKLLLSLLALQLGMLNGIVVLTGLEILTFDPIVLDIYIFGTLLQLFGLVRIITKYWYDRDDK